MAATRHLRQRDVPLEMSPDEFRTLGYHVIDRLASFMAALPDRPVTSSPLPAELQTLLSAIGDTPPQHGSDAEELLADTIDQLVQHSLFTGHPRYWAYIGGQPAPIGMLGDLIASAVDPAVSGWALAPLATEIERQAISWIAQMIGYPSDCGGIFTSGGNMGNFLGLLVARHAKAQWDIRADGLRSPNAKQLLLYASEETHTWVHKAADQFGFGINAIRWISTDGDQRMDIAALEQQIDADLATGYQPFMVIGAAGTVSTGVIDPLVELARVCRERDLWFHIDGAYGAMAALLPDAPAELRALGEADSIALDPHKWLYVPFEAGCTLVRNRELMRQTFSFVPPYYNVGADDAEPLLNYFEYGLQNTRGFRALKVWLTLRQAGVEGYQKMIAEDIELAQALFQLIKEYSELEAWTQHLSITTFRYVPEDLTCGNALVESYLNRLNRAVLDRLQHEGEAYISNAIIRGAYVLRACFVRFTTTLDDVEALPEIVVRLGRLLDAELRPQELRELQRASES